MKQSVAGHIFVAFGANVASESGSPLNNVRHAVERVMAHLDQPQKSRCFGTPCFPAGAGPDYVNAVVGGVYNGTPSEALAFCHSIEDDLGRMRTTRWAARSVDLDLLAFGNIVLPSLDVYRDWQNMALDVQMTSTPAELILPHPRVQDRAFVLGPLRDIAPNWKHPVLNQTVEQMWQALPDVDKDSIWVL